MKLTETQIKEYEDKGFLIIKGVLSPDEIAAYKKRSREMILGDLPPGAEKTVVRDVRVAKGLYKPSDPEFGVWKLLQPDWHDALFEKYPVTSNLLDVCEGVLGPDIKAFLTMMIYKPPQIEANHPFHQDAYYFAFGPHDLIMGTWVALDPTDEENGTLAVIPGSHKMELLDHDAPRGDVVNFGVFGAEGYEDAPHPQEVPLRFQPGDGVFFHSRLLHRSGPNRSKDRHRRVMTMHCASAKCTFEGELLPQLKMRLVRGHEYAGCI